jgi:hypothetical protein
MTTKARVSPSASSSKKGAMVLRSFCWETAALRAYSSTIGGTVSVDFADGADPQPNKTKLAAHEIRLARRRK